MISLTKREREYLLWALRGKTAKETAQILGASPNTASKLLRAAIAKMDAPNKFVAALKASRLGLLEVGSMMAGQSVPVASTSVDPGVAPVDPATWPEVHLAVDHALALQFEHIETQLLAPAALQAMSSGASRIGYSLWSADTPSGCIGLCWFWSVVTEGVVAMWDPLRIQSNLIATSPVDGATNRGALISLVASLPWQVEANRCMHNARSARLSDHSAHLVIPLVA